MSGIFEALPGIEVPVGSISGGLDQMWSGAAADGRPAPPSEDAKAIQVNFVLLLGLRTDAGDAVRQFETAVSFSRRYPCRVVVLCPLGDDSGESEIRAKVYGECSVGRTPDDTRCCEFVMLSYPRSARPYLENEVSICLSTDLPLYCWAHRFVESSRLADYRYLLTTAKRVLIDSATAPADAPDDRPVPQPLPRADPRRGPEVNRDGARLGGRGRGPGPSELGDGADGRLRGGRRVGRYRALCRPGAQGVCPEVRLRRHEVLRVERGRRLGPRRPRRRFRRRPHDGARNGRLPLAGGRPERGDVLLGGYSALRRT